jgi:antitoxin VapB
MGLNIKNEHVHELAREAARVTGKSQTSAIEEALERLLRDYGSDPGEVRIKARLDLVHRIAADYRAAPAREPLVIERVDDLYDDATGLPR